MTVCKMKSQINLSREQAEKLNTRLAICEQLEVFNDSLQSLVQAYQVNFDLLEDKVNVMQQLNGKLQQTWKFCEVQLNAANIQQERLQKELKYYKQQDMKFTKMKRRRWMLFGGGTLAGIVATVLVLR